MSYTRIHIDSNRVRLVQNRKSICAIIGFTFFNFKEKKGQTTSFICCKCPTRLFEISGKWFLNNDHEDHNLEKEVVRLVIRDSVLKEYKVNPQILQSTVHTQMKGKTMKQARTVCVVHAMIFKWLMNIAKWPMELIFFFLTTDLRNELLPLLVQSFGSDVQIRSFFYEWYILRLYHQPHGAQDLSFAFFTTRSNTLDYFLFIRSI